MARLFNAIALLCTLCLVAVVVDAARLPEEYYIQKEEDFFTKVDSSEKFTLHESGIRYLYAANGDGTVSPTLEDSVFVQFNFTLPSGLSVGSSVFTTAEGVKVNIPIELPLKGLVEGWKIALLMLKEGDHITMAVPSRLAFGRLGREAAPTVPVHSPVLVDMILKKIIPGGADKFISDYDVLDTRDPVLMQAAYDAAIGKVAEEGDDTAEEL
eukprot:TRINITY_DN7070_c0_g1_i1.p1 TRINITY_DN7070_c0_g1~~TRINITY_DN7070_c0_g1_i1.p1  ORF type:complete len:232 (+),score=73.40 TRINITY_DN7070_c0_g1_i1:61-696(+)